MADAGNWCLIESDPGVFTELMKGFGVEGLVCEEIYDLNDTSNISDALGLIFLFKWEKEENNPGKLVTDDRLKSIFFAEQVIRNACATQAIINVLLNLPSSSVKIGETLSDFKSFVLEFDSKMKGNALTNCDKIRSVHNSFSYPQTFELNSSRHSREEDAYHFVGYVPIDGVVYELDGLKGVPLEHGPVPTGSSWIDVIKPVLLNRVQACVDGRFNLMAIVPSRLNLYETQLDNLLKSPAPDDELVKQLRQNIALEKDKAAAQRTENLRRRHNYLPFIVELLKVLAENGRLVSAVRKAKEKSEKLQEKAAIKA